MRRRAAIAAMASIPAVVLVWRRNRRTGSRFVNEVINPFLLDRGLAGRSHDNLATLEHIGRRTGMRRLTLIHPVPTDDGFRITVPLGEESEWARNVLAAGHCRMQVGDTVYELDEPALLRVDSDAGILAPLRWLQAQLGFRWLRLHRFDARPGSLESGAGIAGPTPTTEPSTGPAPVAVPVAMAV